jgi:hypothetical protein
MATRTLTTTVTGDYDKLVASLAAATKASHEAWQALTQAEERNAQAGQELNKARAALRDYDNQRVAELLEAEPDLEHLHDEVS